MTKKLLFVDDEPDFLQGIKNYFQKYLKSSEYEVFFAESGEEALTTIEKNNDIDLLLTDLKMPAAKIEGAELIKTLHEQNIALKTIVVSAYGNMPKYTESIKDDVSLFVTKPVKTRKLKELIDDTLDDIGDNDFQNIKVINNSIYDLIGELSSKKKKQLINYLIEMLDLESLEELEQEIPNKLIKQINLVKNETKEIEEMIAKIRRGEIDENTPLELLEQQDIQAKYIPRDGKYNGPYYYLRWWNSEKKKYDTKYLGKTDPRELILKRKEFLDLCKKM
jgi:CheY-like chemotaxis protein